MTPMRASRLLRPHLFEATSPNALFYCNPVGSRVMLWPFGDVFTSSFLCIWKTMQGAQNVLRTLVGRRFLDVTFYATLRCQSAFQLVRSGWFFHQCDAPLGFPFMNDFCKMCFVDQMPYGLIPIQVAHMPLNRSRSFTSL